MRTVILACLLAVLFRVVGRHIWRYWRYYGAGEQSAELVRRSS